MQHKLSFKINSLLGSSIMKLNERPLAVKLFFTRRGTHSLILAIRKHHARLHVVAQVRSEHDILQITLGLHVIDRRHDLYAAIEIAVHPLRARANQSARPSIDDTRSGASSP